MRIVKLVCSIEPALHNALLICRAFLVKPLVNYLRPDHDCFILGFLGVFRIDDDMIDFDLQQRRQGVLEFRLPKRSGADHAEERVDVTRANARASA